MATTERVSEPFREDVRAMPWGQALKRASNYFGWLITWAFLSEVIMVSGVMLVRWGVNDVEGTRAGTAFGVGLVICGLAMLTLTNIAIWIKAGANEEMARLRQLQRLEQELTEAKALTESTPAPEPPRVYLLQKPFDLRRNGIDAEPVPQEASD